MTIQNKPWSRPQLIVLARGRPEERVLQGCKHPSEKPGPGRPNCKKQTPPGDNCLELSES